MKILIVVDANVILSALLGGSARFIFKGLNTPQLAAGMKAHLKKELAHRDAPRLAAGQFTFLRGNLNLLPVISQSKK